jgi:pyruvate/2-oxoglutarate dehydrogenase complex dihydrolipoamide dehydrogenase (E3) component
MPLAAYHGVTAKLQHFPLQACAHQFRDSLRSGRFGNKVDLLKATLDEWMIAQSKVSSRVVDSFWAELILLNVDVYQGYGELLDNRTVQVIGGRGAKVSFTADNVIVATGSRPEFYGSSEPRLVNSEELLRMPTLPERLVIGECRGRRFGSDGHRQKPNSRGIGLTAFGIGDSSFLKVDERMRLKAPGLYAVGDVNGISLLDSTAFSQASVAINSILAVQSRSTEGDPALRPYRTHGGCGGVDPAGGRGSGRRVSGYL